MKFEATLVGFSCRPNPKWILNDEQSKTLVKHLESTETFTLLRPRGVFGILGYAGFSIRVIQSCEGDAVPIHIPDQFHLHSNIIDLGGRGPNLISQKFYELQIDWLRFAKSIAKQIRGETTGKTIPQYANFGEESLFLNAHELESDSNIIENANEKEGSESQSVLKIESQFVDFLVNQSMKDVADEMDKQEEYQRRNIEYQSKVFKLPSPIQEIAPSDSQSKAISGWYSFMAVNPYDQTSDCSACPVLHERPWQNNVYFNGSWSDNLIKFNNCYNYATTKITHSLSQPGRSHGISAVKYTKEGLIKGAKLDGLKSLGDKVEDIPRKLDRGTHLVALAIADSAKDEVSQHWFRLDNNGNWSHKMGCGKPKQLDCNDDVISDLSTADLGSYKLAGYFECPRNTVRVL